MWSNLKISERKTLKDKKDYGDVYSPMKAENTQLQETEWTED